MLTSVPLAISRSSRQVVLMHPNSFDAVISRKKVLRVEIDPGTGNPSEMGATPTLGGMGVLRTEDEADFEYVELGAARVQFAAGSPLPAQDLNERDNVGIPAAQCEVLIEAVAKRGEPIPFIADSGDLVMLTLCPGVVVAYEVEKVSAPVNIPPYTRRLMLNPRDDLNYIEPFTD